MFNASGQSILKSSLTRLVLGFLIFKAVGWLRPAEAAELATANDTCCTPRDVQELLQSGKMDNDASISVAFNYCSAQFLENHKVSPLVKSTVDGWLGGDLEEADDEQLFLLYQLALMGSHPEDLSDQFRSDCQGMEADFEEFRDITAPLANQLGPVQIQERSSLNELDKRLLAYAQYVQFCKSFLASHEADSSN